jgi:uncharacterized protein YneR
MDILTYDSIVFYNTSVIANQLHSSEPVDTVNAINTVDIFISGQGGSTMDFTITKPAVQWFIDELDLSEGDHVRFFARVGGCSTVQSGYSIGISQESPFEAAKTFESDGITFFIEEKDVWYFDDHDLKIKYSRKYDEISYEYSE